MEDNGASESLTEKDSGSNLVRVVVGVVVVLVAIEAYTAPIPRKLPTYALHSTWVYVAERAVPLLIVGLLLVTILYRGLIEGRLPTEIGREGLKWAEKQASVSLAVARTLVRTQREQADKISEVEEAVRQLSKASAAAETAAFTQRVSREPTKDDG